MRSRLRRVAVALALLVASGTAHARDLGLPDPGENKSLEAGMMRTPAAPTCDNALLSYEASPAGHKENLHWPCPNTSDFGVSGGEFMLGANVCEICNSGCVGQEAADFCSTTLLSGRIVDAGAATSFELPNASTCSNADAVGRVCVETTDPERVFIHDGTEPRTVGLNPFAALAVGGTAQGTCSTTTSLGCRVNGECPSGETCSIAGGSGAFLYGTTESDGEDNATECQTANASICRFGTCTTNTCTLPANSVLLTPAFDGNLYATNVEYSSFTLTGGTVTMASSATSPVGHVMIIRVRGDMTINGGTLNMRGIGGTPVTAAATCTASTAGRVGADTDVSLGGAAGLNTGTDGSPGEPAKFLFGLQHVGFTLPFLQGGTGGGASFVARANCHKLFGSCTGAVVVSVDGRVNRAGGGGGGGGCDADCTGGAAVTVGPAGRGGGTLWIEVDGTFACTSGAINVRGDDGQLGGGGGGGGGVVIRARAFGDLSGCTISTSTSCTAGICIAGGAGGTAPTNCNGDGEACDCGSGGAGGDGVALLVRTPR